MSIYLKQSSALFCHWGEFFSVSLFGLFFSDIMPYTNLIEVFYVSNKLFH